MVNWRKSIDTLQYRITMYNITLVAQVFMCVMYVDDYIKLLWLLLVIGNDYNCND